MRSSSGGWVANNLPKSPVMPMAATLLGKAPACMWPKRAKALIMGCLLPNNWAEPLSARNSR